MIDSFKSYTLPCLDYLLEVEYIGEGYNGEYDPSDPNDSPLIRLSLLDSSGDYIDEASYCTNITLDVTHLEMESICRVIANLLKNNSPKKAMAMASHFTRESASSEECK